MQIRIQGTHILARNNTRLACKKVGKLAWQHEVYVTLQLFLLKPKTLSGLHIFLSNSRTKMSTSQYENKFETRISV